MPINYPSQRSRGLKLLKRVYDNKFCSTSTQRNAISRYLYSGLVSINLKLRSSFSTHTVRWNDTFDNFGQLFTGDGYLNTPAKLKALVDHYRNRLNRAGVLQVMHHGASRNSRPGDAKALQPAVSIFSSDPARGKNPHPHAPVLRNFWSFCPV